MRVVQSNVSCHLRILRILRHSRVDPGRPPSKSNLDFKGTPGNPSNPKYLFEEGLPDRIPFPGIIPGMARYP